MELLGRQVDDGLNSGVAQLAVNHQATTDDNRGPLGNVEAHDTAGNDGAHARNEHDLNVALGLDGGDEALHGVGKRLKEGQMVLVRSGNHRRLLVVGVVGDGADVD